jgi:hypothetical protein
MNTLMKHGLVVLAALVGAGLLAASARAAAPSNTSPPTISGTLEQGKTLTASHGTWSNSPTTYSYRWQRCGADGTGCANIDNAASQKYTLMAADVDHTVRVVVTASNADGQASANSAVSNVVSANTAPKNTARPTVSGTAKVGEQLSADHGTWTGGVRSYAYQWQRCDTTGTTCTDVTGATGQTYGIRALDAGNTLRVVVTATNLAGSTSATSDTTGIVQPASSPPPPPTAVNHRPTIAILNVRFVGARVFVRFRACDDSHRNLVIPERDSRRGVLAYTRRFRTVTPPLNCSVLSRTWVLAPRFRHGRYTLTMWARDFAGLTSRPAARTFFR